MPPTLTPQSFVAKWHHATIKERSAAQEHFIDICHLIGHPTPAEQDPSGKTFAFEAGAQKTGGGQGFADVWYKGHFAWEYKGKHANLDVAYQQLLKYREALENPPLLIVSDLDRIIIHTNYTNTIKRVYELSLDDLLKPDHLAVLRDVFYNPDHLKAAQTTAQVTEQAAVQFAKLAHQLRAYGEDNQRIAHFLIRLLFCLFAEDVNLLPGKVFSNLVTQTRNKPPAFHAQLRQLFAAMSTGGWFGPLEIPYFDGHLFDDDLVLELDSDGLSGLAEVSNLDWSVIEPSIFGTLFERSLDPSKRAQLGAHYTSREDILLIVEPVLMMPLRRRWQEVKEQAQSLVSKQDKKPITKGDRTKLNKLMADFGQELAQIQVLDPACGSGNFLYMALRLLLDLWKEVSILASELGLPMMLPLPGFAPSPAQLHGIEINPYAHQLAQATIWIGYIQWLRENGYGAPPEPILRPLDNILQMDAILAYDEQGKPVEPEWPAADVIIGNPPFLGDKKMRGELGDKYVDDLRSLYNMRVPGGADLVTYWFEKARETIKRGNAKRVGLLATNSIRGGANRQILERIKQTGGIFWAQSNREWILDGAAVNVSMIGFDDNSEKSRQLDGKDVAQINSDLTFLVDITVAKRLNENADIAFIGTQKGGPFDITESQARAFLDEKGNPNNRPNSDVVKPWINGLDIANRSRRMWIIDFGSFMPIEQASEYEVPFEYVKQNVLPVRKNLRRDNHRKYWWIHAESRPGMRRAMKILQRYIVTPRVSKHRLFIWQEINTLPDSATVVITRSDDYFLGVLHSKCHELWALRQGTSLEDRPRYTPTTTFETFPFPWPPGHESAGDPRVEAIAQAARELVEKRDNWLNPPGASEAELKKRTLTNLYNQRPTWLDLAHKKLDRAVFAAYGWPDGLGDEEILERLLALNLERSRNSENQSSQS